GEDKMSKSLGNLVTAREAVDRWSADAIRLFVLSSHYRSPLTFSPDILAGHEQGSGRLRRAAEPRPAGSGPEVDPQPFLDRFVAAMDDDFNTARAVAALFDLVTDINSGAAAGRPIDRAQGVLRELSGVLGLTLKGPDQGGDAARAIGPLIDLLIETRRELRAAKQWALADRIRDGLQAQGIALEDTPNGTVWRRAATSA
ncbi:MAG TPA: DALR domain-containing protein, partial [Dehalococcoidia bacterium]|nr:DALR domain-containing protein [Dehalococcoidia bacterium]